DLGGEAHRNRLQLTTSQVSTIEPGLTGRWDKKRRINLAWEMIRQVKPSKFITHVVSVREAPSFYRQLSEGTKGLLQVVFEYRD
ncbi:MAG: oxidoreductase, partial [Gammaproteobacteria bacterium]|nr:oxidoreductase [Gammaproteobacteria bacterium]